MVEIVIIQIDRRRFAFQTRFLIRFLGQFFRSMRTQTQVPEFKNGSRSGREGNDLKLDRIVVQAGNVIPQEHFTPGQVDTERGPTGHGIDVTDIDGIIPRNQPEKDDVIGTDIIEIEDACVFTERLAAFEFQIQIRCLANVEPESAKTAPRSFYIGPGIFFHDYQPAFMVPAGFKTRKNGS